MADNNKVRFGLKNVHYAKFTPGTPGTYGTPVAIPGAVNLDLTPEGSSDPFYADNTVYYQAISNQGYSGSLEIAKVPLAMYADIWGLTTDADGNYTENAETEPASFALMFQIDGDTDDFFHLLYNVTATRPNIGSATIEASKTPQTQTIDITAIANADGDVHTFGPESGTIATWAAALLA